MTRVRSEDGVALRVEFGEEHGHSVLGPDPGACRARVAKSVLGGLVSVLVAAPISCGVSELVWALLLGLVEQRVDGALVLFFGVSKGVCVLLTHLTVGERILEFRVRGCGRGRLCSPRFAFFVDILWRLRKRIFCRVLAASSFDFCDEVGLRYW